MEAGIRQGAPDTRTQHVAAEDTSPASSAAHSARAALRNSKLHAHATRREPHATPASDRERSLSLSCRCQKRMQHATHRRRSGGRRSARPGCTSATTVSPPGTSERQPVASRQKQRPKQQCDLSKGGGRGREIEGQQGDHTWGIPVGVNPALQVTFLQLKTSGPQGN